jgi:chromosome segregation ATPase
MDKLTAILKQQKKEFEEILTIYQEDIESQFNSLIKEISYLKDNLSSKDSEITTLNTKITDNKFNQQNYQNFSMVSNLSKQVTEKELEIKKYQSQLRNAKKEIDSLKERIDTISEKGDEEIEEHKHEVQQMDKIVEVLETTEIKIIKEKVEKVEEVHNEEVHNEEVHNEEVHNTEKIEEEEEQEQEISYVRKKIKGVYYYVSDEEQSLIYQCLENNEVGEVSIGRMNGKKAEFY